MITDFYLILSFMFCCVNVIFLFFIDLYPVGVYNGCSVLKNNYIFMIMCILMRGCMLMSKECERCKKLVHRSDDEKNSYIKRLNRIEGQVRGINKMVEDDRYCDDIMIQISAVSSALKSLGQEILLNHMKTCMVDDINNKKYDTIDEVMELCRRMM